MIKSNRHDLNKRLRKQNEKRIENMEKAKQSVLKYETILKENK